MRKNIDPKLMNQKKENPWFTPESSQFFDKFKPDSEKADGEKIEESPEVIDLDLTRQQ